MKVVAITGTAGKTTTKRLVHAALSTTLPGTAAPRSFNNDIGVPLTLLAVRPEDVRLQIEQGDSPNSVMAEVVWVEFLGSTYRIDLALGGDEAQLIRTELSANMMREMAFSAGVRLSVVLPAELLWVYGA